MTWNITELKRYIDKHIPNEFHKMSISEIKDKIKENEFLQCMNNIQNEPEIINEIFRFSTGPIYMMYLMPTDQYYIIDGKHRLYKASCDGCDVDVYILKSDALVPFLSSDKQRARYVFIEKCLNFGSF